MKRLEACAGDLHSVHAVCSYRKTGPDTFPYMLFAFKDEVSNTDGYTVTIPAHTWAIFPWEPHQWISSERRSKRCKNVFTPNGSRQLAMSRWMV
ncbi:hypothetical protein [Paenibacillus gansuensis]|uniref:Uncharacterized protein n=1 Tax=Paenibacillus gansuensis TaxID=306542 RepID=A0ABW5PDV9_9BACL